MMLDGEKASWNNFHSCQGCIGSATISNHRTNPPTLKKWFRFFSKRLLLLLLFLLHLSSYLAHEGKYLEIYIQEKPSKEENL